MSIMRALNTLVQIESGALSSAQLESLLADPKQLGELATLIGIPAQAHRISTSATVMSVIVGSTKATDLFLASNSLIAKVFRQPVATTPVFASASAMAKVVNSSYAMDRILAEPSVYTKLLTSTTASSSVFASTAAMAKIETSESRMLQLVSDRLLTAIQFTPAMTSCVKFQSVVDWIMGNTGYHTTLFASAAAMVAWVESPIALAATWANSFSFFNSSAARLALYNSNFALASLQAQPTLIQSLIATASLATTATWDVELVPNGTKVIILRRYYSGTANERDFINYARGSSSRTEGPVAGSGGRTLYNPLAIASGSASGTYTASGTPYSNAATANFVCAANGIRRQSSQVGGTTLYVYYITV